MINTESIYVKGRLIKEIDTDERRNASLRLPASMVTHYVSYLETAIKDRRHTMKGNYGRGKLHDRKGK